MQNLAGLTSNFEEMTIVKDKQLITGYSEIFQETSTFESIDCEDKQMEEEYSDEYIEKQYDHEK